MGWSDMPTDAVCHIFSHLTLRERYRASCVCVNWTNAFHMQKSWDVFVFKDYVFTRRKYLQIGPQYVPDYFRLRFLINRMAPLWRVLIVKPVTMLFNMYEFLRALTNYCDYYDSVDSEDTPLGWLRSVEFSWSCKYHTNNNKGEKELEVYGTGGQLLKGLTNFLANLKSLQSLVLRQLLLDFSEAEVFVSDLLNFFGERLLILSLRNFTKVPYSFPQIAFFLALQKLVLSPTNISSDLLQMLVDHRCLSDLVIIQDDNTPECAPVDASSWLSLAKGNPFIVVHLVVTGRVESPVIWQPFAPVVSICFEHPRGCLTEQDTTAIIDYYAGTLQRFVQRGRQRRYRSKSYRDRADPHVVHLVESCQHMRILAIRERLSAGTVLLLAQRLSDRAQSGDTVRLMCRRKAVLRRVDRVFRDNDWDKHTFQTFRRTARNFVAMEKEVARLFNLTSWRLLSDSDYKHLFSNRGIEDDLFLNFM